MAMSKKFFDHTCNIYHLEGTDDTPGFGLQTMENNSYPETADIEGQICHVHVGDQNVNESQRSPQRDIELEGAISFPIGTDVRVNDRIEDLTHGKNYIVSNPRNIRGNHIKCDVYMLLPQRSL